jgi:hypothetical protein
LFESSIAVCHGIERKGRIPSADESNMEDYGATSRCAEIAESAANGRPKKDNRLMLETLGWFDGEPHGW